MNKPLPPIAQTLSNMGLVQADDIANIAQSNSKPMEIMRAVTEQKLITKDELYKELSLQFGTPLFDVSCLDKTALPTDLIDPKLVEKHTAIPIYRNGKSLFVAMVDPTNTSALDEIKFSTGFDVIPVQAELAALEALAADAGEEEGDSLEEFLGDGDMELDIAEDDQEEDTKTSDVEANEAPIVKYVNKILVDSINRGASDIHIEPFEKELRIRFRIDGMLHKITTQPISYAPRIVARIKIISKLDIAERRAPQDGRVKLRLSKNKAIDFRVNTLPTVWGEKIVMRLLDSSAANLDLNILGFTDEQLELYEYVINQPYGMVLITGPTGSGKTVTLYSALNKINDPAKNISTVEDPVEIMLPGITQVNVNNRANLDFAAALRAFLRQDPDILMLGEIRDLETAEIAIKAAQTGHMVFSTLHTNDAPATLTRLLNMGVPAFNVASAVNVIVAQRLARKLCNQCRVQADIPDKALLAAGYTQTEIDEGLTIFSANPTGCTNCTQGYKGRAGIFQVMPISKKMKGLIMAGCTENEIEACSREDGILDLRQSGLNKVKLGLTSLEEVERVTNA